MTVDSENYEQFTQCVLAAMVGPGVTVHHQRVYVGRVSHREIKVDVSFNYDVVGANVLFIVECKCYTHLVPVDDVEEFHSKLDDIGAHKGIIVTTVGFQEGAVKTAQGRGIALALLTSEHQRGELTYVLNAARPPNALPPIRPASDEFWQGNLRGPCDVYQGGFRFEGFREFLGFLCMDLWKLNTP